MLRNLFFLFIVSLFTVQSASAQVRLKSELMHTYNLNVGEIQTGELVLENLSDVEREVKVYQRDYQIHFDNSTLFTEPASLKRSNSSWITVFEDYVYLAPGELKTIPYEVSVPNVKSPGTYWSLVMVEPIQPAPATADENIGVQYRTRYGVVVLTDVGDTDQITKSMDVIGHDVLTDEKGGRMFHVASKNTGNLGYRSDIQIQVFDSAAGTLVKDWAGTDAFLYPGSSSTVSMDVTDLTPGNYQFVVVYDTGDDEVFGARYNVEITG